MPKPPAVMPPMCRARLQQYDTQPLTGALDGRNGPTGHTAIHTKICLKHGGNLRAGREK